MAAVKRRKLGRPPVSDNPKVRLYLPAKLKAQVETLAKKYDIRLSEAGGYPLDAIERTEGIESAVFARLEVGGTKRVHWEKKNITIDVDKAAKAALGKTARKLDLFIGEVALYAIEARADQLDALVKDELTHRKVEELKAIQTA